MLGSFSLKDLACQSGSKWKCKSFFFSYHRLGMKCFSLFFVFQIRSFNKWKWITFHALGPAQGMEHSRHLKLPNLNHLIFKKIIQNILNTFVQFINRTAQGILYAKYAWKLEERYITFERSNYRLEFVKSGLLLKNTFMWQEGEICWGKNLRKGKIRVRSSENYCELLMGYR